MLIPAAWTCLKLLEPVALAAFIYCFSSYFLSRGSEGHCVSYLGVYKNFTSPRQLINLFIRWLLAVFDGKRPAAFKAFIMLRQTQKRIMNWRIMLHKAKRVSLKISPLQIEHYCFSIAHWVPIKSTLPHGVRLEITIIKSQWPIRCKWHHCSLIIKLFSCHVSAQWKGSFFLKNVYLYMKGCGSLFWGGSQFHHFLF